MKRTDYLLITLALIVACGAAYVRVQRDIELESLRDIVTTQSESIMVLEKNNQQLREEVERLKQERDKAASDLAKAQKESTVTTRGGSYPRLTLTEMKALAGTVHREAENQPALGKMLVARVALNRLRWNPDMNLHQILLNKNAFAIGKHYTEEDMQAVMEATTDRKYNYLSGFHNPETATNPEAKTRKILLVVGDPAFW